MPNVDFTSDDAQIACPDDTELKVITLRKGPGAGLSPSAEIPFNDLSLVGGVSDTGKPVTLGDIEAGIVERIKQARANDTIPQNTRGSSEIQ